MAAATASFYRLREERMGRLRVLFLAVDVTSGGADGVGLTAGSGELTDVSEIVWVNISGACETGGYVCKYVVDAEATADGRGSGSVGDGDLIWYESDDAVDPLDATTDAVGVEYIQVYCY